jgi:uncharacterized protein YjiK
VVTLTTVSGMLVALADTAALPIQDHTSADWVPPSDEPSGAAWIEGPDYLFVVDTNAADNDPDANGWQVDIHTGAATSRATGVEEPSGIDYDPATNTLFITQDDGHIFIFEDFDTPGENMIELDVTDFSFDTEDPAFNSDNGRLYWMDGADDALLELNPVDGVWGNNDDIITSRSVSHLNDSNNSDWEGLAWDPRTGNLLVANTLDPEIYEVTFGNPVVPVNTITLGAIGGLTRINGMGIAPASYDSSQSSLWLTDRNSSQIFEISFDGTVPPSTSSTSTTQAPTTTIQVTTTTTQGNTTTTQTTTTTTQGNTTTTQATTTTTTQPGATTTTTVPGTTTTTQPGGGGGGGGGGGDDPFTDDDGHLFENAIEWLADQGITQGCNPPANTKFCPNDRVTRGQMAAFLVRAKGYSQIADDFFVDDEGHIFENAINRFRTAGVTQGCNPPANNRFCPDQYVTRGQMAAFLVRAFGYSTGAPGDFFLDDDGSIFEGAIDKLRVAEVTLGCNPPADDRYCPDDYVTRGQMAAFLKRAFGG